MPRQFVGGEAGKPEARPARVALEHVDERDADAPESLQVARREVDFVDRVEFPAGGDAPPAPVGPIGGDERDRVGVVPVGDGGEWGAEPPRARTR